MASEGSPAAGAGELPVDPDLLVDRQLPVDPDLEPAEDARHQPSRERLDRERLGGDGGAEVFGGREPPRLRSRLRPDVLAVIAVGGSLGGGARYLIERAAPAPAGTFPWATFGINVTGAFALAVLLVLVLEVWPPTRYVRPFAAVGFLGAYTTFSTWMLETADLVSGGRLLLAAGYVAGSLAAGLAAVAVGLVVGRSFLTRRTPRRL